MSQNLIILSFLKRELNRWKHLPHVSLSLLRNVRFEMVDVTNYLVRSNYHAIYRICLIFKNTLKTMAYPFSASLKRQVDLKITEDYDDRRSSHNECKYYVKIWFSVQSIPNASQILSVIPAMSKMSDKSYMLT